MDIEKLTKELREAVGYKYVGRPNNAQTREAMKYHTEQLLESYRQELGFAEPFKAKLKVEEFEGTLTITETIEGARRRIREEIKRISAKHLEDKLVTKESTQTMLDEIGSYLSQEAYYYRIMYGIDIGMLFIGAMEDED